MARNGAGVYSLPAGNPVVVGTTIDPTWANNTLTDIGTALTQSVAADGQTTITANLPMGGYRHTGVGAAAATTDYARADQSQNSSLSYLSSVSGVDTITATATPTPAAYAAGQSFRFIAAGDNTGAVTLNVSSLGAKSVTKFGANALIAGDIKSGAMVEVQYDGTQFQIKNQIIFSTSDDPVINGEHLVAVAATSGTLTAGGSTTSTTKTTDCHYAWCTGANVAWAQASVGQLGFKNGISFTGAASVTAIGHGFRIESANSARFKNKTVTGTVRMYNSLLTSVTWTAYYVNALDTFGSNGSGAKTQIATGTITLTAADSTLRDYTFSFAAGANADLGMVVEFTVGAQTSGSWVITGEDLVEGTVSRPYPHKDIETVKQQCRRYRRRYSTSGAGIIGLTGQVSSATSGYIGLPGGMFASSTITFSNLALNDTAVAAAVTAGSATINGDMTFLNITAGGGGLTTGRALVLSTSAAGYLDLDCSL